MFRLPSGLAGKIFPWLLFSLVANFTWAQSETATVSGQVVDPPGLNITGAQVKLVDIDRDTTTGTATNTSGLYTFPSVRPGRYRMEVTAAGFKVVNVTGITVNVQDHLEQNFKLTVGSVSESVTIEGGASLVATESATVSTVVDRNFAENLPMNGRSFQTLIQLTPGVVLSAGNGYDQGQFNVNGQRGYSNYWMVDGVSANIGINASSVPGGGAAGALQSFSAQGGTNSLVSVDALQEFRIDTSTYAPEFGRTPGGQISIVTRSGTNQFHGAAFDYLRNDVLDANDWFADYNGLRKPEERQNDFGGTFGGPLTKNRTFFFFSYEGLRLRLPQVTTSVVPDLAARQNAIASVQPFLRGFPQPNGPELGSGTAEFNESYSNHSTLNATSLRLDHKVSDNVSIFGRYNYAPSDILQLGGSEASPSRYITQTATIGTTVAMSAAAIDDLRFNFSSSEARSSTYLDTVGDAVVPSFASLLPSQFSIRNSEVSVGMLTIGSAVSTGPNADNVQHQINVVNSLSLQKGTHTLKFGVDYRRLFPSLGHPSYVQDDYFNDVPSAEMGSLSYIFAVTSQNAYLVFNNFSAYAQDTWRTSSRLTVTYGLRWDIDFAPSTSRGPALAAVTSCCNLSTLTLAPAGTRVFSTTYRNVAPRIGIAYQIPGKAGWETVLRGGFGLFYDLASPEASEGANYEEYPFGSILFLPGGTFPGNAATAVPPPVSPTNLASGFGVLFAFDPRLKLPCTLQWNGALEQAMGGDRSIAVSYIGAAGRRLIQSEYGQANAAIVYADVASNVGTSDYNALQVRFQQRLSHNLQVLGSYTWAHSIDTASASSFGATSNYYSPQFGVGSNRGPSDFDVRDAVSAGLTYDIPVPRAVPFFGPVLRGWSLQSIVQARSALPDDVDDQGLAYVVSEGQAFADVRPDVVPGKPLYLHGPEYPGDKAFNPAAFTPPPIDPTTGVPLRQGDLGRNAMRGFGATQWDFAVHRDFPLHEAVKLQFRAEMFNILNHPNFGPPVGDITQPLFGLSTETLANSLSQTGSSLSSLYQFGGPRSIQFALKLMF